MVKRQTFLHGALILVCANLIVKIIGAVFRIPIYRILDGGGYANYQDAYSLYAMLFAIGTAGIPVAIQNMISIANAEKNYEEGKKIFRLAFIIFVLVGAVGTGAMIVGARAYSSFVKNDEAYLGILVLAPTLFFVCITAAFRGYFQGHQNMIPTAVSEIIEALCKLAIGIGAAMYALNKYGAERLDIVAAYAISGLTIGVALGAFYLFLKRLLQNRVKYVQEQPKIRLSVRSSGDIIKEIITFSLPVMLSSLIVSMAGTIDSRMMKWRLEHIGWGNEAANEAYGDYFGMAVPFFSLPNTLVVPFAVSIISVISAAYAAKNRDLIKSTVESTFRVSLIIAMPFAFGIAGMSKPILLLAYLKNSGENLATIDETAPLLSILGIAVVFVSMMTITNAMLQAQRQERKTIISMACGMAVKIISSYILIGIPEINRYGTPISTCLCYFTIMALNFYFLVKYTGIVPPIRRTFVKPFMSSAIMSVCTILVYMLFNNLTGGSRIAVIPAVIIAAGIYAALTLAFKTLTRDDVLLLPKGAKIYDAMKKRNLIE